MTLKVATVPNSVTYRLVSNTKIQKYRTDLIVILSNAYLRIHTFQARNTCNSSFIWIIDRDKSERLSGFLSTVLVNLPHTAFRTFRLTSLELVAWCPGDSRGSLLGSINLHRSLMQNIARHIKIHSLLHPYPNSFFYSIVHRCGSYIGGERLRIKFGLSTNTAKLIFHITTKPALSDKN